MKYDIVVADSRRALVVATSEKIEAGWQPLGAPFYTDTEPKYDLNRWSQAIIYGYELKVDSRREWHGGPR